jgi:hypothetical protein
MVHFKRTGRGGTRDPAENEKCKCGTYRYLLIKNYK